MQLYYNSNIYTTITLTFTLTIYLLTLTLPIHAIHFNAILKQGLQEIRNYLQYRTDATKNDTTHFRVNSCHTSVLKVQSIPFFIFLSVFI